MHSLEESLNKLSDAVWFGKQGHLLMVTRRRLKDSHASNKKMVKDWSKFFSAKIAKIEFPCYVGDDTTEWFSRVAKFFLVSRDNG